jgi:small subunit ribosomal protein S16
MAVRIRLTRKGAKKKPYYRIVAADSEAPRDGKFLEVLGTYDPLQDPAQIKVDGARLQMWLERGATPSDTVFNLLKAQGMLPTAGEGEAAAVQS